mmetsp:Transcript_113002/g.319674  ORF Transcript_113002/g.319674 Transcript_113002/m.319674 type:complete len:306 (+) Transcript_113002:269-1186(+)
MHKVPDHLREEGAIQLDLLQAELREGLLASELVQCLEGDAQNAQHSAVPIERNRSEYLELPGQLTLDLELHGTLALAQHRPSRLCTPRLARVAQDLHELRVEDACPPQHFLDRMARLPGLAHRPPVLAAHGIAEDVREVLPANEGVVRDDCLRRNTRRLDQGRMYGELCPCHVTPREDVLGNAPDLANRFHLEVPTDPHECKREEPVPLETCDALNALNGHRRQGGQRRLHGLPVERLPGRVRVTRVNEGQEKCHQPPVQTAQQLLASKSVHTKKAEQRLTIGQGCKAVHHHTLLSLCDRLHNLV